MKHPSFKTFRFTSYEFLENKLYLRYALDDAVSFEEILTFENAPPFKSSAAEEAFGKLCQALHLAAGISYYKAFCPKEIRVETRPLSSAEAKFWDGFYVNGLGEFAYKNGLDLAQIVSFPADGDAPPQPSDLKLSEKAVVPIGGGKDSLVTLEALKAHGMKPAVFSLRRPKPIEDCIRISGCPWIEVSRELSPALAELAAKGAYNGHVPVTGILSFILAAAAVLYDFNAVVFSNERSANVGNIGHVNHQWSKSFEFEYLFSDFIKNFYLKNLSCFSFLRPLSELAVASHFAKLEQYHGVFRSCNKAFFLDPAKRLDHWCCACDKCRFVFLALAPFMPKEKLIEIFGKDLLDDPAMETGYRELLGLSGIKPFDCVGEADECQAAFSQIKGKKAWQDDYIVRKLSEEVPFLELDPFLKPAGQNLLAGEYKEAFDALTGS